MPEGSFAIAFLYTQNNGPPTRVSANLTTDLELTHPNGYEILEVFTNKRLGKFLPSQTFTCIVNPTGVQLFKAKRL
jgi:hypothetical protein